MKEENEVRITLCDLESRLSQVYPADIMAGTDLLIHWANTRVAPDEDLPENVEEIFDAGIKARNILRLKPFPDAMAAYAKLLALAHRYFQMLIDEPELSEQLPEGDIAHAVGIKRQLLRLGSNLGLDLEDDQQAPELDPLGAEYRFLYNNPDLMAGRLAFYAHEHPRVAWFAEAMAAALPQRAPAAAPSRGPSSASSHAYKAASGIHETLAKLANAANGAVTGAVRKLRSAGVPCSQILDAILGESKG